ncbi:YtxH domain-containing protein [Pedococcus sp.]|uniref:YtxH domain-containing protein n=1 Tax=Pedococcus sp. TaxID=2860345 RepID=UPI002E126772|nr:YtxH domain-containing protein [Pedococcus sp.]
MSKLSFLAGLGVGYVLGAKAGQKRYNQIRTQADRVWSSGPVQSRVDTVKQTVKEQAPVVAAKLGDAAKSAGASAMDRVTGEDLPPSLHRGTDGHLHADTTGYGPGGERLP